MWFSAIPIFGDIVKSVVEFANRRWGYNKGEQEIEKITQEALSESNILQAVSKFAQFTLEYEGAAKVVPRVILYARSTWRPVLQWGLTIKVLIALFIQGQTIEEMQATIIFVGGLALLREVGKKFTSKEVR